MGSKSEESLAPIVLVHIPWLMSPWHYLSQCVKEGGIPFKKAYGIEVWEFASQNDEFNSIFNNAMASSTRITSKAILAGYKDGFKNIGSLVDVGRGMGVLAVQIVKSYPHIKVVNFDLPHVLIKMAPKHNGVLHVEGDMFESIPNADAVLLKWIMHDWSDEACIKILKNCRKATPEKTGKLIIVDVVLQPDRNCDLFDDRGLSILIYTSIIVNKNMAIISNKNFNFVRLFK